MAPEPIRPLTDRQRQLAALVVRGLQYVAIAHALGISRGRVRNAVREIADLLPNPDRLTPYRLVANYYGHVLWSGEHTRKRE